MKGLKIDEGVQFDVLKNNKDNMVKLQITLSKSTNDMLSEITSYECCGKAIAITKALEHYYSYLEEKSKKIERNLKK